MIVMANRILTPIILWSAKLIHNKFSPVSTYAFEQTTISGWVLDLTCITLIVSLLTPLKSEIANNNSSCSTKPARAWKYYLLLF